MSNSPVGLIPHLRDLQTRIRLATAEHDAAVTELGLEQLPYTLAAAGSALTQIVSAQHAAAESVRKRADPDLSGHYAIHALNDAEYYPIAFAVDSYLESARRAQNAVIPYVTKVLGTSVPKTSLHDLVKKLIAGRVTFPDRIKALIVTYWSASGELLKNYRDLSQHHLVVASERRIVIVPDGCAGVYVVLPSNPTARGWRKLAYGTPRVDALIYAGQSFEYLFAFAFELTHLLLSYTTDPGAVVFTGVALTKGPLLGGPHIDAHQLIDPQWVSAKLENLSAQLKKRLDAEMPRTGITPTLVVPRG